MNAFELYLERKDLERQNARSWWEYIYNSSEGKAGGEFSEQRYKEAVEHCKAIADKYDAMSNRLNTILSSNYIDVEGVKLSLATAERYLGERDILRDNNEDTTFWLNVSNVPRLVLFELLLHNDATNVVKEPDIVLPDCSEQEELLKFMRKLIVAFQTTLAGIEV